MYGHSGHLVQSRGTIGINCPYPFNRRPHVKSVEIIEGDILNLHYFIHVYSPGARADNHKGKKFWLSLKCFITLIIHCMFQWLVFHAFWETNFLTSSPYRCMGTQIWPCREKVKGQHTVTIWTNLVDLESSMLYTEIQPWNFLGSGEKDRFLSVFIIHGHGGHLN